MVRLLLMLISTLFLFGCPDFFEENLHGTYEFKNEYIEQKLLIKPDKMYEQSILILENNEQLKSSGCWRLYNNGGWSSIIFRNYISLFDYAGSVIKDYHNKNNVTAVSFSFLNYFGRREIGFHDGKYYKKIKNWNEGDTLE